MSSPNASSTDDFAQVRPAPDQPPPAEAASHPGVVTFVDADSFSEYEVAVENLPAEVAWAETDSGYAPVTRIVGRRRDGSLDVESYSAEGRLLHVVSRPTTD